MIAKMVREHAPEWLEAGAILIGMFVGAIAIGAVALYRIDDMAESIDTIEHSVESLPLLQHEVYDIKTDIIQLNSRVHDIEINTAEHNANSAAHSE